MAWVSSGGQEWFEFLLQLLKLFFLGLAKAALPLGIQIHPDGEPIEACTVQVKPLMPLDIPQQRQQRAVPGWTLADNGLEPLKG